MSRGRVKRRRAPPGRPSTFFIIALALGLTIFVLLFVQMLRGLRGTQWQLGSVPEAREVVALAAGLELAVFSFLVSAFFLPFSYSFVFFYLAGMAAAVRTIGGQVEAGQSLP